jgi:hypothetical protein
MRDPHIRINWRHFWCVFAVLFVALMGLAAGLVARRPLGSGELISLAMLSIVAALVLSLAICGGHRVVKMWLSGELRVSDFFTALLALLGIAFWFAVGAIYPVLATILVLAYWAVLIVVYSVETRRGRKPAPPE